ncbi:hypothetical protein BN159_1452 [Streptomyces davaonensis JCM 4913]|uniref:Uncharacterized protein n=1 Tax=Streptomyces davaonensis (strain DSM 101723 / JCM 4913 / KCC S-0913 / 768) TaxID=1214101 RepID=K4QT59_STRDJ|nr:penicillin-binding transpeptidase domain-containing protein [Streptomyces davaonensis]CCK25831.1 hypothetical protein BN159_1452 [Streptomyces davaonensis JCM 4913]
MRERRRHALLVATSSYEDPSLRALWAPIRDATDLARILGDPAIGAFTVEVLNDVGAHELRRGVEDFFADCSVSDTLLLHFACHGLKDEGGKLFLAARDTVRTRLESTAIPAEYVSRLMLRSRAGRAAVMLDCCYAGAFERGLFNRADPDVHVEDNFSALERSDGERGRAVLTASSAVEYAFEGSRMVPSAVAGSTMGAGVAEGEPGPSLFTGALVEGLRTGEADLGGDGAVGLAELAEYIGGRVRAVTPHQNPQLWMFGAYGDLTIARSVRRPATVALPMGAEVRAEPDPLEQRLRSVADLRASLDGPDVSRALAALAELRRLARDESGRVREAALEAGAAAAPRTTTAHWDLGVIPVGRPGPESGIPVFGPPVVQATLELSSDSEWLRIRPTVEGMALSALTREPGVYEGHVIVRAATGECELTVSVTTYAETVADVPATDVPVPAVTLLGPEPSTARPVGRRLLVRAHAAVAALGAGTVLTLGIRAALVPGRQFTGAHVILAAVTVLYLMAPALIPLIGRTRLPRLSPRGQLLHGVAALSTVGVVVVALLLGRPADGTLARYDRPRGDILVEDEPITGSKDTGGKQRYQRTYSDGQLYAAVSGYASQAFGTSLLEQVEDEVLTATRTSQRTGQDVATTINASAQKAAFSALGDREGAVVALDPRTGAILALVSTPSYDPSTFAGASPEHDDAWKKLQNDKKQPMLNRALRQTYPPGSTFKVVTAAAALENDLYTSIEDRTNTPSPWTLPETTTQLSNETDAPCENASLKDALRHSCNTVFGKIGFDLGSDKVLAQAEEFGFNAEHLVPLRAVESIYPEKTSPSQNALSAIGQYNTRATPLEMAMVAAAVANDGTLMRPYLVRAAPADGDATEPKVLSRPTSEATARKLQQMMRAVVDSGTGTDAAIRDVEVGGKPGTAQSVDSESAYAWFISYAKAESASNASVAVAVVVQDDEADGAAAPIARKVMEAVLD